MIKDGAEQMLIAFANPSKPGPSCASTWLMSRPGRRVHKTVADKSRVVRSIRSAFGPKMTVVYAVMSSNSS